MKYYKIIIKYTLLYSFVFQLKTTNWLIWHFLNGVNKSSNSKIEMHGCTRMSHNGFICVCIKVLGCSLKNRGYFWSRTDKSILLSHKTILNARTPIPDQKKKKKYISVEFACVLLDVISRNIIYWKYKAG